MSIVLNRSGAVGDDECKRNGRARIKLGLLLFDVSDCLTNQLYLIQLLGK